MSLMDWPDHLLSLEEWEQLPEDDSRRFELVDGVLRMSPNPGIAHQEVVAGLCYQLRSTLVAHGLAVAPSVEVVLVEDPALVRVPDLIAVDAAVKNALRIMGSDVRLAVEVVSPGSARVDRVAKMAEYAEVGIPNYWIADLGERISIDVFTLKDGVYQLVTRATGGLVEIEAPARMTIDLDDLR